ncbi:MAG: hypothetical protein HUJ75_01145 [Parasporobacterium sp.]|nr:hypothetical protein [Parasporobacterium sp.]
MKKTENSTPEKKKKTLIIIICAAVVVLLAAVTAFKLYVDSSYKPLSDPSSYGSDVSISDNTIIVRDVPEEGSPRPGIIIYTDFRVEPACYIPLMLELKERGFDCYIPVSMGNIPQASLTGADSIIKSYSASEWYILGHGAGVSAASQYINGHPGWIRALIALGGTSDKINRGACKGFLSVEATEDKLYPGCNEKNDSCFESNIPGISVVNRVIEGGNHAGFAETSSMSGDGEATIKPSEQWALTADAVLTFVEGQ